MSCQIAATAVTLYDLKGYSQVAGLFKCSPSTDSVLARFLCIRRALCLPISRYISETVQNRDILTMED